VMNGLRGGDLDIGWVAGAQSKPVTQGEMINIASGIPAALIDNPEAPKITDLGSDFNLDGYFMFIAPGNMAPDVRKALGDAIRDVLTDSSTEAYGFAQKAFGGASVLTGEELDAYMADSVDASKKLIKAVSN
jgi:tripartite-type tricarboxylate transporter receptor subunit TctC